MRYICLISFFKIRDVEFYDINYSDYFYFVLRSSYNFHLLSRFHRRKNYTQFTHRITSYQSF